MEIALINPPNHESPETNEVPLSLGYLASYLEQHHHSVKIFDFERNDKAPADLVDQFYLSTYPLVGITTYTQTMKKSAAIASRIKQVNPQSIVVVGGYHVSELPRETLTCFPDIDVVVKKDGELPLLKIIESLQSRNGYHKIPNIAYRYLSTIKINQTTFWKENLDEYPYPKREVENYDYLNLPLITGNNSEETKRIMNIVSSLGCPYQCSYCAISKYGENKVRFRSVKSIISELKETIPKFFAHHIFFQDPNFFIQPTRALEIAQSIHREFPGTSFSFETRADQILASKAILVGLKKYGCSAINVGVENANLNVLKHLNKGLTPEENLAAILYLKHIGIRPQIYMIMFNAESTPEELKTNIDFLKMTDMYGALPHESILYCRLQPLPGTTYRRLYQKRYGIADPHELPDPVFLNPYVESIWKIIWKFRTRDGAEVLKIIKRINLLFKRGVFDHSNYSAKTLQYLQLLRTSLQLIPYQLLETCITLAHEKAKEKQFQVIYDNYHRKTERILRIGNRILFTTQQSLLEFG